MRNWAPVRLTLCQRPAPESSGPYRNVSEPERAVLCSRMGELCAVMVLDTSLHPFGRSLARVEQWGCQVALSYGRLCIRVGYGVTGYIWAVPKVVELTKY